MYKFICANITKSRNFTSSYKKLAQNKKYHLDGGGGARVVPDKDRLEEKLEENQEQNEEEIVVTQDHARPATSPPPGGSFQFNSTIQSVKGALSSPSMKVKNPKFPTGNFLTVDSPTPRISKKYHHVYNITSGPTAPRRYSSSYVQKFLSNEEGNENYKKAIEELCNIESKKPDFQWKSSDTKRPIFIPSNLWAKKYKKRSKTEITYPTHTIKHNLTLSPRYRIREESIEKKAKELEECFKHRRKLQSKVFNTANAKKITYPTLMENLKKKGKINSVPKISPFQVKGKEAKTNYEPVIEVVKNLRDSSYQYVMDQDKQYPQSKQMDAIEEDFESLIRSHPTIQNASKEVKMRLKNRFIQLLLKSSSDRDARPPVENKASKEATPKATIEEVVEEVEEKLARNEEYWEDHKEQDAETPVNRDLKDTEPIKSHPSTVGVQRMRQEEYMFSRYPKRVWLDTSNNFDVDKVCMRDTTAKTRSGNLISRSIATEEPKLNYKNLEKEAANLSSFLNMQSIKQKTEDPIKKPKHTAEVKQAPDSRAVKIEQLKKERLSLMQELEKVSKMRVVEEAKINKEIEDKDHVEDRLERDDPFVEAANAEAREKKQQADRLRQIMQKQIIEEETAVLKHTNEELKHQIMESNQYLAKFKKERNAKRMDMERKPKETQAEEMDQLNKAAKKTKLLIKTNAMPESKVAASKLRKVDQDEEAGMHIGKKQELSTRPCITEAFAPGRHKSSNKTAEVTKKTAHKTTIEHQNKDDLNVAETTPKLAQESTKKAKKANPGTKSVYSDLPKAQETILDDPAQYEIQNEDAEKIVRVTSGQKANGKMGVKTTKNRLKKTSTAEEEAKVLKENQDNFQEQVNPIVHDIITPKRFKRRLKKIERIVAEVESSHEGALDDTCETEKLNDIARIANELALKKKLKREQRRKREKILEDQRSLPSLKINNSKPRLDKVVGHLEEKVKIGERVKEKIQNITSEKNASPLETMRATRKKGKAQQKTPPVKTLETENASGRGGSFDELTKFDELNQTAQNLFQKKEKEPVKKDNEKKDPPENNKPLILIKSRGKLSQNKPHASQNPLDEELQESEINIADPNKLPEEKVSVDSQPVRSREKHEFAEKRFEKVNLQKIEEEIMEKQRTLQRNGQDRSKRSELSTKPGTSQMDKKISLECQSAALKSSKDSKNSKNISCDDVKRAQNLKCSDDAVRQLKVDLPVTQQSGTAECAREQLKEEIFKDPMVIKDFKAQILGQFFDEKLLPGSLQSIYFPKQRLVVSNITEVHDEAVLRRGDEVIIFENNLDRSLSNVEINTLVKTENTDIPIRERSPGKTKCMHLETELLDKPSELKIDFSQSGLGDVTKIDEMIEKIKDLEKMLMTQKETEVREIRFGNKARVPPIPKPSPEQDKKIKKDKAKGPKDMILPPKIRGSNPSLPEQAPKGQSDQETKPAKKAEGVKEGELMDKYFTKRLKFDETRAVAGHRTPKVILISNSSPQGTHRDLEKAISDFIKQEKLDEIRDEKDVASKNVSKDETIKQGQNKGGKVSNEDSQTNKGQVKAFKIENDLAGKPFLKENQTSKETPFILSKVKKTVALPVNNNLKDIVVKGDLLTERAKPSDTTLLGNSPRFRSSQQIETTLTDETTRVNERIVKTPTSKSLTVIRTGFETSANENAFPRKMQSVNKDLSTEGAEVPLEPKSYIVLKAVPSRPVSCPPATGPARQLNKIGENRMFILDKSGVRAASCPPKSFKNGFQEAKVNNSDWSLKSIPQHSISSVPGNTNAAKTVAKEIVNESSTAAIKNVFPKGPQETKIYNSNEPVSQQTVSSGPARTQSLKISTKTNKSTPSVTNKTLSKGENITKTPPSRPVSSPPVVGRSQKLNKSEENGRVSKDKVNLRAASCPSQSSKAVEDIFTKTPVSRPVSSPPVVARSQKLNKAEENGRVSKDKVNSRAASCPSQSSKAVGIRETKPKEFKVSSKSVSQQIVRSSSANVESTVKLKEPKTKYSSWSSQAITVVSCPSANLRSAKQAGKSSSSATKTVAQKERTTNFSLTVAPIKGSCATSDGAGGGGGPKCKKTILGSTKKHNKIENKGISTSPISQKLEDKFFKNKSVNRINKENDKSTFKPKSQDKEKTAIFRITYDGEVVILKKADEEFGELNHKEAAKANISKSKERERTGVNTKEANKQEKEGNAKVEVKISHKITANQKQDTDQKLLAKIEQIIVKPANTNEGTKKHHSKIKLRNYNRNEDQNLFLILRENHVFRRGDIAKIVTIYDNKTSVRLSKNRRFSKFNRIVADVQKQKFEAIFGGLGTEQFQVIKDDFFRNGLKNLKSRETRNETKLKTPQDAGEIASKILKKYTTRSKSAESTNKKSLPTNLENIKNIFGENGLKQSGPDDISKSNAKKNVNKNTDSHQTTSKSPLVEGTNKFEENILKWNVPDYRKVSSEITSKSNHYLNENQRRVDLKVPDQIKDKKPIVYKKEFKKDSLKNNQIEFTKVDGNVYINSNLKLRNNIKTEGYTDRPTSNTHKECLFLRPSFESTKHDRFYVQQKSDDGPSVSNSANIKPSNVSQSLPGNIAQNKPNAETQMLFMKNQIDKPASKSHLESRLFNIFIKNTDDQIVFKEQNKDVPLPKTATEFIVQENVFLKKSVLEMNNGECKNASKLDSKENIIIRDIIKEDNTADVAKHDSFYFKIKPSNIVGLQTEAEAAPHDESTNVDKTNKTRKYIIKEENVAGITKDDTRYFKGKPSSIVNPQEATAAPHENTNLDKVNKIRKDTIKKENKVNPFDTGAKGSTQENINPDKVTDTIIDSQNFKAEPKLSTKEIKVQQKTVESKDRTKNPLQHTKLAEFTQIDNIYIRKKSAYDKSVNSKQESSYHNKTAKQNLNESLKVDDEVDNFRQTSTGDKSESKNRENYQTPNSVDSYNNKLDKHGLNYLLKSEDQNVFKKEPLEPVLSDDFNKVDNSYITKTASHGENKKSDDVNPLSASGRDYKESTKQRSRNDMYALNVSKPDNDVYEKKNKENDVPGTAETSSGKNSSMYILNAPGVVRQSNKAMDYKQEEVQPPKSDILLKKSPAIYKKSLNDIKREGFNLKIKSDLNKNIPKRTVRPIRYKSVEENARFKKEVVFGERQNLYKSLKYKTPNDMAKLKNVQRKEKDNNTPKLTDEKNDEVLNSKSNAKIVIKFKSLQDKSHPENDSFDSDFKTSASNPGNTNDELTNTESREPQLRPKPVTGTRINIDKNTAGEKVDAFEPVLGAKKSVEINRPRKEEPLQEEKLDLTLKIDKTDKKLIKPVTPKVKLIKSKETTQMSLENKLQILPKVKFESTPEKDTVKETPNAIVTDLKQINETIKKIIIEKVDEVTEDKVSKSLKSKTEPDDGNTPERKDTLFEALEGKTDVPRPKKVESELENVQDIYESELKTGTSDSNEPSNSKTSIRAETVKENINNATDNLVKCGIIGEKLESRKIVVVYEEGAERKSNKTEETNVKENSQATKNEESLKTEPQTNFSKKPDAIKPFSKKVEPKLKETISLSYLSKLEIADRQKKREQVKNHMNVGKSDKPGMRKRDKIDEVNATAGNILKQKRQQEWERRETALRRDKRQKMYEKDSSSGTVGAMSSKTKTELPRIKEDTKNMHNLTNVTPNTPSAPEFKSDKLMSKAEFLKLKKELSKSDLRITSKTNLSEEILNYKITKMAQMIVDDVKHNRGKVKLLENNLNEEKKVMDVILVKPKKVLTTNLAKKDTEDIKSQLSVGVNNAGKTRDVKNADAVRDEGKPAKILKGEPEAIHINVLDRTIGEGKKLETVSLPEKEKSHLQRFNQKLTGKPQETKNKARHSLQEGLDINSNRCGIFFKCPKLEDFNQAQGTSGKNTSDKISQKSTEKETELESKGRQKKNNKVVKDLHVQQRPSNRDRKMKNHKEKTISNFKIKKSFCKKYVLPMKSPREILDEPLKNYPTTLHKPVCDEVKVVPKEILDIEKNAWKQKRFAKDVREYDPLAKYKHLKITYITVKRPEEPDEKFLPVKKFQRKEISDEERNAIINFRFEILRRLNEEFKQIQNHPSLPKSPKQASSADKILYNVDSPPAESDKPVAKIVEHVKKDLPKKEIKTEDSNEKGMKKILFQVKPGTKVNFNNVKGNFGKVIVENVKEESGKNKGGEIKDNGVPTKGGDNKGGIGGSRKYHTVAGKAPERDGTDDNDYSNSKCAKTHSNDELGDSSPTKDCQDTQSAECKESAECNDEEESFDITEAVSKAFEDASERLEEDRTDNLYYRYHQHTWYDLHQYLHQKRVFSVDKEQKTEAESSDMNDRK